MVFTNGLLLFTEKIQNWNFLIIIMEFKGILIIKYNYPILQILNFYVSYLLNKIVILEHSCSINL